MRDQKPLSDTQAHDLLVAAADVLRGKRGETVRADTALKAARTALNIVQMGLVAAMEKNSDRIEGLTSDDPT